MTLLTRFKTCLEVSKVSSRPIFIDLFRRRFQLEASLERRLTCCSPSRSLRGSPPLPDFGTGSPEATPNTSTTSPGLEATKPSRFGAQRLRKGLETPQKRPVSQAIRALNESLVDVVGLSNSPLKGLFKGLDLPRQQVARRGGERAVHREEAVVHRRDHLTALLET